MGNIKQINTKNYTYYFFEDFNPSLIKIDKSHTKILPFTILDTSQRKTLIM